MGGEVAQGMQDVTVHLKAHDLHSGHLAKVSVVAQHWNMACKVFGGHHSSTLLLLSCALVENACSAVCGN